MKPTYSDAGKLAWYPDIACPVCGGDVLKSVSSSGVRYSL